MKFGNILFDLDGTLTDPAEGITNSIHYALARLGLVESDQTRLLQFIGPPLLRSFEQHYSMSPETAREAVAYYREYYSEKGIFENEIYPGIRTLLEKISASGRTIIVATAKPTVYAERILTHFQIRDFFKMVVGAELNGRRTEKADVIEAIKVALPPEEWSRTLMIGDHQNDINGARAHALPCLAVTYGYGSLDNLRAASPAWMADCPEQIWDILERE